MLNLDEVVPGLLDAFLVVRADFGGVKDVWIKLRANWNPKDLFSSEAFAALCKAYGDSGEDLYKVITFAFPKARLFCINEVD